MNPMAVGLKVGKRVALVRAPARSGPQPAGVVRLEILQRYVVPFGQPRVAFGVGTPTRQRRSPLPTGRVDGVEHAARAVGCHRAVGEPVVA